MWLCSCIRAPLCYVWVDTSFRRRRISPPSSPRRGYPTASVMLQGSGVSTDPPAAASSCWQRVVWSSKLTPFSSRFCAASLLAQVIGSNPKASCCLRSASARRSRLSGVSRPARQTWPWATRKERGKRKESDSIDGLAFYKHHTKWPKRRSSSQRGGGARDPRLERRTASWYCKTNRVLRSQIELEVESIT